MFSVDAVSHSIQEQKLLDQISFTLNKGSNRQLPAY